MRPMTAMELYDLMLNEELRLIAKERGVELVEERPKPKLAVDNVVKLGEQRA